jgi:hypothetical protein
MVWPLGLCCLGLTSCSLLVGRTYSTPRSWWEVLSLPSQDIGGLGRGDGAAGEKAWSALSPPVQPRAVQSDRSSPAHTQDAAGPGQPVTAPCPFHLTGRSSPLPPEQPCPADCWACAQLGIREIVPGVLPHGILCLFHGEEVSQAVCPSWSGTTVLPNSDFQEAKITGLSHRRLATFNFVLNGIRSCCRPHNLQIKFPISN